VSARVVYVDFVAWGASEAQQRRVCGPRGYILRGAEARAAAAVAADMTLFASLRRDGSPTPVPSPRDMPIHDGNVAPIREPTLPGLSAWLNAQRAGVHRP